MDIYYNVTLNDGTVFTMLKGRAGKLKDGAIPTIFNEYPENLKPAKKRKPPPQRVTAPNKKKKSKEVEKENVALPDGPEIADLPGVEERSLDVDSSQNSQGKTVPASPQRQEENESETDNIKHETTWSHLRVHELKLPIDWVVCNTLDNTEKSLVLINNKTLTVEKSMTIRQNQILSIKVRGIDCKIDNMPLMIEQH